MSRNSLADFNCSTIDDNNNINIDLYSASKAKEFKVL